MHFYSRTLRKVGVFSVSAALAFSLASGVTPVALAQAAPVSSVTRAADAAKADAYDEASIQELVAAYQGAGFSDAGAKALKTYLEGKEVSAADFATIDTSELAKLDELLAKEIKALQALQIEGSGNASSDSNTSSSASNVSNSASNAANESNQSDSSEDMASTSVQNEADQQVESPADSGDASAAETPSVIDEPTDATTDGTLSSQSPSEATSTYVPGSITSNPSTSEFIASIGEEARIVAQNHDLYASVMIAQAVLESGSGSSALSRAPYYNLFGIKGSYNGQFVTMSTSEDDGTGNHYSIDAAFRWYPSTQASLEDYADLLTVKMATFYAPVRKSNAVTYVDACNYLQGHYATDTSYSAKLQDIIAVYHLTDYDMTAEEAAAAAASAEEAADDAQYDAIVQAELEDAALIAAMGDRNGSAAQEDGEQDAEGESQGFDFRNTLVPGVTAVALATVAGRRGLRRRDAAMDAAKTLPLPASAKHALGASTAADYEPVSEGRAAAGAEVA